MSLACRMTADLYEMQHTVRTNELSECLTADTNFYINSLNVNRAHERAIPSPAGAGPVKHLVHGSDPITPHGCHVPTCHDGIVHP